MQSLSASPAGAVASRASHRPASSRAVAAQAVVRPQAQQAEDSSRRSTLLGLASVLVGSSLSAAAPQPAAAGPSAPVPVGQYLPATEGLPGFCTYTPDDKKTPALRAGVIKPDPALYQFSMPETWSEAQLLNILTGNFCMPRCEEPWYEARFESPKEGQAQVIVTELQKLGAKPTAKLADLGAPEQLILRIGNFVTGTNLEEEDVVSASIKQLGDGRDYYLYEVFAPYSKTGGHNLAAFTTKGPLAYLFVLTANEKQWGAAEGKLRTMLETFRA